MASSTNLQSLEQFEQKLYFIKIVKFGENIADDWSTSTGSNFILKKKEPLFDKDVTSFKNKINEE